MAKKRYTPEMMIRKRHEAEILRGQGKTIAQVVKHIGIADQAFTVGARSMAVCAKSQDTHGLIFKAMGAPAFSLPNRPGGPVASS